jgi:hypothetical protein
MLNQTGELKSSGILAPHPWPGLTSRDPSARLRVPVGRLTDLLFGQSSYDLDRRSFTALGDRFVFEKE